MSFGHLTDAGGALLLDIALGDAAKHSSLSLKLFTDSGALTDGQATRSFVATEAGYAPADLLATASASTVNAGIPTIQWEDITFTFTGPLTDTATIKGCSIVAGSTIIYEQLLPGSGYQPMNSGDQLIVTPLIEMGNVPGGGHPA